MRVAVVTGAAGGIGAATVRAFADVGWRVVGVDRRDTEVAGASRTIGVDVGRPEEIEGLFEELAETEGHLDALVNNAAIQVTGPLDALTPADWDDVMQSNARSAFLATRAALPLLRGRDSSVVNVSSVHAVATSLHMSAYAASKGAMLALSRALAVELAPEGVRVNAVLPGAIDTPMLRAGLARDHLPGEAVDARMAGLAGRTVAGRIGRPEEVAHAILFLCDGDRASFITGASLVVDGGATAKLSTE